MRRIEDLIKDVELEHTIANIITRLKKLEELTKANEYEFITETKLLRKGDKH